MTKKDEPWMTLDEHYAQLKAEGRYEAIQELHRRQEEERQRKAAAWRLAEKPLVNDLKEAGVAVESVWDLVNTKESYPAAIPILFDHLRRPYPERVREGIARALAVPEARMGWKVLLDEFKKESDNSTMGVKFALGLALGATGTDAVWEDVFSLLKDNSLGENRAPLLAILERSNDPRALHLVQELAADPDLVRDVKKILGKIAKKGDTGAAGSVDLPNDP